MAARGSRLRRPGPHRAGAAGLLVSRRFGPLFATQFLSAFNDNALKNALVLMIAYRPAGPGDWPAGVLIPLAGGLFILPFFLCSATAGRLADMLDKAFLIRLIKLCEIGVMLLAAAAVLIGHAGWLLFLLFAMGVEAAFFGPLKYAILPDLLAPTELLLGNALVEAGTFLAILLGTIAGMLIAGAHGRVSVALLIVAVALAAPATSLSASCSGARPGNCLRRVARSRTGTRGAFSMIRSARYARPARARLPPLRTPSRTLSLALSRISAARRRATGAGFVRCAGTGRSVRSAGGSSGADPSDSVVAEVVPDEPRSSSRAW